MNIKSYIIPLSLFMVLNSCNNAKSIESEQSAQNYNSDSMHFVDIKAEKSMTMMGSANFYDADKDLVLSNKIELVYPEKIANLDISDLQDSILTYISNVEYSKDDNIEQRLDKIIDGIFTDFDIDYSLKPCTFVPLNEADGYFYTKGSISYLSPQILTYAIESSFYSPRAAHGMFGRTYINYSLDGDGRIISLNDIFTPEGVAKLPQLIRDAAEARVDLIGQTDVDALPANNNFYISSEGQIVFSFQPYEIAPFSAGIVDIPLDPDEMVDILTPFALQLFGLSDLASE